MSRLTKDQFIETVNLRQVNNLLLIALSLIGGFVRVINFVHHIMQVGS